MIRAFVVAAVLGLFSGNASANYQPPSVPYSGCLSSVTPEGENFSCSIVIPMVMAD